MYVCQDIGTEVENHALVKARVSTLGSQLMTAQPGNIVLRSRLQKLSRDWQRLITTLHDTDSHVHAARMLLLPLRQTFSELMLWLQSAEKTIREGSNETLTSSADIQCEQQKYRVHSVFS